MNLNNATQNDLQKMGMVDLSLICLAIPATGTIDVQVVFKGSEAAQEYLSIVLGAAGDTLRNLLASELVDYGNDDAFWDRVYTCYVKPSATMYWNASATGNGTVLGSIPSITSVPAGAIAQFP